MITRDTVVHPGAVAIIPRIGKDRIVLLRQFRCAAKGDLWEIPAGTLDDGERPLRCARRELEEETGYRAKRFRILSRFYPAPGISSEIMTLFSAEGLVAGKTKLDPDELIYFKRIVTLKEAMRMIQKKLIRDAKTIIGVFWLRHFCR